MNTRRRALLSYCVWACASVGALPACGTSGTPASPASGQSADTPNWADSQTGDAGAPSLDAQVDGNTAADPSGADSGAPSSDARVGKPIFATTYSFGPVYSDALASEVDEQGQTYVLAAWKTPDIEAPPLFATLRFAANGAASVVDLNFANEDRHRLDHLRVRGGTLAIGGTVGGPHYDLPLEVDPYQILVLGFLTDGTSLFQWTGPDGTTGGPVDVCADGTVVAAGVQGDATILVKIQGDGSTLWQTSLTHTSPTKVRCGGDNEVRLSGIATDGSATAVAAQYDAGGTLVWSWGGADAGLTTLTFDIDAAGDLVLAGTRSIAGESVAQAYAVASGGALQWSWNSAGPSDFAVSVAADDAGGAVLAGWTGSKSGTSYPSTFALDASGRLRWSQVSTSVGFAVGVSLDRAGNAFVCEGSNTGQGTVALYGRHGSTRWSDALPSPFLPVASDVTNGVGRCIGTYASSTASNVELIGFKVR